MGVVATLTHPFKTLHSVRKSQVLQLAPDELLVKLAPYTEVNKREVEQLVKSLQARVGGSMQIRVEVVDDIPPEESGKYRWVVSRVAKERVDLDLWNP